MLVEEPIGGDGVATVGAVYPFQGAKTATGFCDQNIKGGEIPQVHLGLGGNIDRPLGDKIVGPEITETPQPPLCY